MAKKILLSALFIILLQPNLFPKDRDLLNIGEIPGYQIVKGDFHMHTVFSDGNVWPSFRVEEAWYNGLDAISITDHIEYQPHEEDIPTNHNRPYEIALSIADALGITLIRGSEITRPMPPGHLNAIFLKDADLLDVEDWQDAIKAAYDQGAFIFWNHPGWTGQQPDGIAKWYDEHSMLYEKGWLHGMEIVNEDEYYPKVHQWCIEKNVTILGNSDIHGAIDLFYDSPEKSHRPMTWILAKENSKESIKEALFDHRTIVYWRDNLFGHQEYLASIFKSCVHLPLMDLLLKENTTSSLEVENRSDLTFTIIFDDNNPKELKIPTSVTLLPGKTKRIVIRRDKEVKLAPSYTIKACVENLKTTPTEGLAVSWNLSIK